MLLSFNGTAWGQTGPDTAGDTPALRIVDAAGAPVPGAVVFAEGASGAPPGLNSAIDQRDKRFVPLVSVVAPGATVSFPNSDDVRHHVYSFSDGNAFERKLYRANDADPVTFDREGVVALGCNIHDNMQAFVLVTARPIHGVSREDGVLAGYAPSSRQALDVWHPLLNTTGEAVTLAAEVDERGPRVVLPLRWQDPQERRSTTDLEKLLREFSRGTP
jgi:plastocyanin